MSKASTQWEKANISYQNYVNYIKRKIKKFELHLIDLLYIRNFKGGNASIHEEETSVDTKLKEYSKHLEEIDREFGNKQLRELSEEELESLKKKVQSFIQLTKNRMTAIDGFKSSYASALLHFYFPDLIPILDRRVLNGVGIEVEKNSQGQVINIEEHYPELIDKFFDYLKKNPTKSLRDYDKECFTKPIRNKKTASV